MFPKPDYLDSMGGDMVKLGAVAVMFVALAAGAASVESAAASPAQLAARSITAVDQLEPLVLAELNRVRVAHSLVPLRLSKQLSTAADLHSRAMGRAGFFAHESKDGSPFWKRVERFYSPGKFARWTVGENLLWTSGTIDAKRALTLWMASPKHRKNILTPRWREVGLSAVSVPAAPGVFGGRDVVIITSDFGVRT